MDTTEVVTAALNLLGAIVGFLLTALDRRPRKAAQANASGAAPATRPRRGIAGPLFLVLALTAAATLYFNVTRTQPPILSLTPDRGGAGTTVTIVGAHFGASPDAGRRQVVEVRIGNHRVKTTTINTGGDFTTTFEVPAGIDIGPTTVVAKGERAEASAAFTVT